MNGNWSDASKWFNNDTASTNNGVPDDNTDIVVFDAASGSPTVTVDGNYTIQQLQFNAGTTPNIVGQQFALPERQLTFDRTGSNAVIIVASAAAPTLGVKIVAGNTNLDLDVAGQLNLSGDINRNFGFFRKLGSGTVTINGNGETNLILSTGFEVNAGTLRMSRDIGVTQITNVTINNGGTLLVTAGSGDNEFSDTNGSITVNAGGILRLENGVNETFSSISGTGAVDLQGGRLNVAFTSTFGGTFSSSGTISGRSADLLQILQLSGTQPTGVTLTVLGHVRLMPGSNFSNTDFVLQLDTFSSVSVLDGNGSINAVRGGSVESDTFLTPGVGGSSPAGGRLTVGSLAPGGSSLDLGFTVLGPTAWTDYDQIVVTGNTVNITGATLSKNFGTFTPTVGQVFRLIDNQGSSAITGTLKLPDGTPLPEGATVESFNGGNTLVKISYVGGTGNDLVYNVTNAGGGGGTTNLSPGGSPGIGTLTQTTAIGASETLAFTFDVNGTGAGTGHDQIVVSGAGSITVQAGDTGTINFPTNAPAAGSTFRLIDVQNSSTIAPIPGLPAGQVRDYGTVKLNLSYTGGDGNDVVLTAVDPSSVVVVAPPTFSPNGRVATYTDLDGDLVTVRTNKGGFTAQNFVMVNTSGATGAALRTLDLSAAVAGLAFRGASISVAVTKAGSGDGFVNIGRVNATGIDLKSVTVFGELQQVDAGDAVLKTAGLGTLSALAMGVNALDPLFSAGGAAQDDLTSTIVGNLSSLKVAKGKTTYLNSQIFGAFIDVSGSIGKIAIDNLNGRPGLPTAFDGADLVTFASSSIRAVGKIGNVFIENAVVGTVHDYSGTIWSRTSMGKVTLGGKIGAGNLVGGSDFDSGAIFVGSPDDSGTTPVFPFGGKMKGAKIKGNILGGFGENSGTIYADGGLGAVSVLGNVIGAQGMSSGSIVSSSGIASVKIGGTLTAGSGDFSGSILAFGGNVGSVTVTQAIDGGTHGILVNGTLKSVTTGALNGTSEGFISALGRLGAGGNAIGSVRVFGNVTNWNIIAGFDTDVDLFNQNNPQTQLNPDASIGTVTVGGNFNNSRILAGTVLGVGTDTHMPGDVLPTVLAKIAKITITGLATNSLFEAQKISSLRIAGVPVAITAGSLNLANGSIAAIVP